MVLIVASSRSIVFITIGILILPSIFGINGIWSTIVFAEVITVLICFKLFKKSSVKNTIVID